MGFDEIYKLITTGNGGIAALALFLYWMERQDNKELRREQRELLERVLTALIEAKDAMRAFRKVIGRGNGDDE